MPDNKRPITAEDLNRIHYVQDPQISPDGRAVAFVKVSPDPLDKSYKRNIWLYSLADGALRQLTRGDKDSQPRWSPDGAQLAFVSARGDKPQVYLLPTAAPGGEARALTSLDNGAHSPDWSPDGGRIAFLAPLRRDERETEDADNEPQPEPVDKLESKHQKERQAEDELERWDPRPMWRIPYRQGTAYVDERYDQVYVADTAESSERKPKRLTAIDADFAAPRWSHDGASIYTSRTTTPLGDEPWRALNIFRLNAETGAEAALTDGEYSVYAPKPSPDGKWIACERSAIGVTDMPTRLLVMAADGSDTRIVNEAIDRETIDYAWSPEGVLALTWRAKATFCPGAITRKTTHWSRRTKASMKSSSLTAAAAARWP